MSSMPWGDHLLSLEEWDELEFEPQGRVELSEGVVLVVPRPAMLHQRVTWRLTAEIERQLPPELTAVPDFEVVVQARTPATVRAPDVVVVPSALAERNPPRVDAAEVVLAVEIISPGTRRTDSVTKMAEYAEAGIRHYWVLDPDAGPLLTAFSLVDGTYEVQAAGDREVRVLTPVPLTVAVPELSRR